MHRWLGYLCKWQPTAKCRLQGKKNMLQPGNMYTFPRLAIRAHLGQLGTIPDMMMIAAAEALCKLIPQLDVEKGVVYPCLSSIR